jgi:hypothetical protein
MSLTENPPRYTPDVLDQLASFRTGWETVNETNVRVLREYTKLLATGDAPPADEIPEPAAPAPPVGQETPFGDLKAVFAAGFIKPGDRLIHKKTRSGATYLGIVTTTGTIVVDGKEYNGASNSLKAAVGSEINGWGNWRHEATGQILQYFRDQV